MVQNPTTENISSERVPKTTQFGISNFDNHIKVEKNKSFVEMLKATLDKEKMSVMTKILIQLKEQKDI